MASEGHQYQDRVSLEIARCVAARLRSDPKVLDFARRNLAEWRIRNSDSPGLVRLYDEWSQLLDRGPAAVEASLLDPSDEGQRLRQNSPFAGVLDASEVLAIKRQFRGPDGDEKTAA